MKKTKLLTSFVALALVLSLGACSETEDDTTTDDGPISDTGESTPTEPVGSEANPRACSLEDIIAWDSTNNQYLYTGDYVTVSDATVIGGHGNTRTVYDGSSSYSGYRPSFEIVLAEGEEAANYDIVTVTGKVSSSEGRAQIVDAKVTKTGSANSFYYYQSLGTSAETLASLPADMSGLVTGGDAFLQIVSYNEATEFVPGTDLNITFVFDGDDPEDESKQFNLTIFGDLDEDYVAYLNAFFFGTEEDVGWYDPAYRGYLNYVYADWPGFEVGDEITGYFHLYYKDGAMGLAIDDLVGGYLEEYGLIDEENELSAVLQKLNQNDDSAYYEAATYEYYMADELSLDDYYALSDEEYAEYISGTALYDLSQVDFAVSKDYYEEIWYDYDDSGDWAPSGVWSYQNGEKDGKSGCYEYYYDDYDDYFWGDFGGNGPTSTDFYEDTVWSDAFYSLFDLDQNGYSTSFRKTQTGYAYVDNGWGELTLYNAYKYRMNDQDAIDLLWDILFSEMLYPSWLWKGAYGTLAANTLSIMLVPDAGYLEITFEEKGMYYTDNSYEKVAYCDMVVTASINYWWNDEW